ncbi:MAG: choice-of-anchor B family protein [Saprospiraceae bacterium]|nr:choice-of-anchor B family protein [Saprospiraceae bacterium]
MKKCVVILLLFVLKGIAIAQVSQNMTLLANWDDNTLPVHSGLVYNDIWGYAADGREYAILGSAQKVHFLDVTNPASLVHITAFAGGASSIWRDMKTYGQYAYSVADQGTEGLMIFDLSNLPASVTKVSQITTFFVRAHNIFIDTQTGRLYIAGANSAPNGIIVLDLNSDPANPTLLANVSLPGGYVHDVYVENNQAYCSHGGNGLHVYNMTNPTLPMELGAITDYPEIGYNHSSWRSGNYLVFADETHGRGLKCVDVSDLSDMVITDIFRSTLLAPTYTNSIAHNPFILGNYCYVSYYHEGVQVFDISNPDDVVRVAYYDTYTSHTGYSGYDGCWGVYPFLPSGRILGADILNGLFILQLSFPVLPVEWGAIQAHEAQGKIKISWSTLTETGLCAFDIERSPDGRSFASLGQIPGSVMPSSQKLDYVFWDSQPIAGTNYYRIRQVDPDGSANWSELVSINLQAGETAFKLYPSLLSAGQMLHLQLPTGEWQLSLMQSNGLLINRCDLPGGSATWPTQGLLPGIYYFSAINLHTRTQLAERFVVR